MTKFWKGSGGGILVNGSNKPLFCADCPCAECVFCSVCNTGTLTECTVKIVISGVVDDLCDSCSSVNGTHIIDISPTDNCAWKKTISTGCGDIEIEASLWWDDSSDLVVVRCDISDAGYFEKEIDVDPAPLDFDCSILTDYSLPVVGNSGSECDISSATCLITVT